MARRTTGRPALPGPDDFSTSATYRMNPYLDISQMPTAALNPPLPECVADEMEEALDPAGFATVFLAPRDALVAIEAANEYWARQHEEAAIRERIAARETERELVRLCATNRVHVRDRNALLAYREHRRLNAEQREKLSHLDDLIMHEWADIAGEREAVAHMCETARRHVEAAQTLRRNQQNQNGR